MHICSAWGELVRGAGGHSPHHLRQVLGSLDQHQEWGEAEDEYELWNPMALYASIPFMMGHSAKGI